MRAPTDKGTPSRPFLARLLVHSWEYRYPRILAGIRYVAGLWNLFLGGLMLSYGYWLGLVPLAGSVVLFWAAHQMPIYVQRQHDSIPA